ncbi:acyl-CoA thioesterase [Oceaniglobus ichthyenteri]|uniref:acyl-CoA thioesterase n=1 Tax=Oceaniglobus ichthyenteri TaxID=2136177 RepID=UPI000D359BFE|nr:thioesterase family protein [Oceaniglobus ichthyenteri]
MFSFPQKVLFKHCDPAGIVFYPRYFEMMNDCVEAFFDSIDHPFESLHGKNAVPMAQISTRFQAPSRHGDHLIISLEVLRLGNASLDIQLNARAGGEARFTTDATLVYINADGRPVRWPDTLRQSFTSHLRSTP